MALPLRHDVLRQLLARAGGDAARAWTTGMAADAKSDGTPVTAADLAAEACLADGLRRAFPEDGIVTEERGGERGSAAWWSVDPIDGTSSFLEGLAHWGPTVARFVRLEHPGTRKGPDGAGYDVDCGAIYLPRVDEFYYVDPASRSAWCNGERLAPLRSITPRPTVYLPSRFHAHYRLAYGGKTRCIGGTAAHLALVARGAAEGVIVAPGWSTWDTAAGLSLIEVVGGIARRLPDGAPDRPIDPINDEGQPFVAGTPELVAAFLRPGAIQRLPPLPREDSR